MKNFHIFSNTGAVVIGRNEGDRLIKCLKSLQNNIDHIVYVDSGSTDKSVLMAKDLGVEVVELDLSQPFTAARARNAGVESILNMHIEVEFIQFVDGDCEVQTKWLSQAMEFLVSYRDYAVVCGRRRERFPEASVYNQLCDIEWDTPPGETKACGGDALVRVSAFKEVNGYRNDLIAGEEPEMCYRLRQLGWKIMRLDAEMTLHDADMTRIGQWWKRHQRAGHAFAEAYHLHGQESESFRYQECRSILIWALTIPLVILIFSWFYPIMLLAFMLYPVQIVRLALRYKKKYSTKISFFYAVSNVFSKWPQLIGWLSFWKNKLKGNKSTIIEYK